jgi:endonuclease/exonuclease/phosphatase family metal-dependent hydrolase
MDLPVAVFNVDATTRHRSLNTQDALLAHLAAGPLAAPVAVYTEVSSKFFAARLAAGRDACYADHAFGRADRTVQLFPPEYDTDAPTSVSDRGKYLYTPLSVDGQTVLLYTVHLSRRDAAARKRQLGLLVRSVEKHRGDAHEVVVCGDFNTPCDALLERFAGMGLGAAVRPGDAPTAASGSIDNLLATAPITGVARWADSKFTHVPFAASLRVEK